MDKKPLFTIDKKIGKRTHKPKITSTSIPLRDLPLKDLRAILKRGDGHPDFPMLSRFLESTLKISRESRQVMTHSLGEIVAGTSPLGWSLQVLDYQLPRHYIR